MGFGLGSLSSQLGAITVSAVPDSQSAEVGGLQNTATNLGASLGTALIGSALIATLSASVIAGIQNNPEVPPPVQDQATVQLAAGVPFISDTQLQTALDNAGVDQQTADAIMTVNHDSRLEALRVALTLTALLAICALFVTGQIPREAVGATKPSPTMAQTAKPDERG
jgi:hypothetical protein